jgi:hypothetical protein
MNQEQVVKIPEKQLAYDYYYNYNYYFLFSTVPTLDSSCCAPPRG